MDQSNPELAEVLSRPGSLWRAGGTLYTQPGAQNQRSVIKHIAICNPDTVARQFSFYVAKAGETFLHNMIWYLHPLQPNATEIYDWGNGGMAIEPGGSMGAWADADGVLILTVSGIEYF